MLSNKCIIYQAFAQNGGINTYFAKIYQITAVPTNCLLIIKFPVANTGACTLNINGYGAVPIVKNVTEELEADDISENQFILLVCDGQNYQMVGSASSSNSEEEEFSLVGVNRFLTNN